MKHEDLRNMLQFEKVNTSIINIDRIIERVEELERETGEKVTYGEIVTMAKSQEKDILARKARKENLKRELEKVEVKKSMITKIKNLFKKGE